MALFSETIGFSVQSQFFNANDLSWLGGCGTRPAASGGETRTSSPSYCCRFAPIRFPRHSSSIGYLPAGRQEIDIHSKADCFVIAVVVPQQLQKNHNYVKQAGKSG
jgi:hypothetical protein